MIAVTFMKPDKALKDIMSKTETPLAIYLKSNRIKSGLSQAEVAAKLGYRTPQFISNWERGISLPPINAIDLLADLFSLPSDQIFQIILETSINQVGQNMRIQYNNRKKSG